MPKYLDGVQTIDDVIQEFKVVASGTINVGTNQYPQSSDITRPTKLYHNYSIFFSNKSGQTVSGASIMAINSLGLLPNTATNSLISTAAANTIANSINNNAMSTVDLTNEVPNMFALGNARIQFNLAAAPTSGTIDWVLIGY
jgi:phosphotransferase system HPr-like phosphotransfer protein